MRIGAVSKASFAICFISIAGAGEVCLTPALGAEPPAAADPLVALNIASRAAYRRAKEDALIHAGPVVLLEGDDLVLKNGPQRTVVPITPDVYTALKAVSHVPLAVHALLGGKGDGPLDDKQLADLRRYRDTVAGAAKGLEGHGLSDAQIARQKEILDDSVQFLDLVLDHKKVGDDDVAGYLRRMRPQLDANTADAARAEIDALHRQMTAWKAKWTDDEWKRLTVIVMGSQLPRQDNLAVQYFDRLLGEKGEGGRVVYSEAIWDEDKALELMATRAVDSRIGAAFFGDPVRMNRDLLGDAAKKYLDELFKQPGP